MSLSTARSFLSEAGHGEQELDANSALMELDKGAQLTLMLTANTQFTMETAQIAPAANG